ncbi:sulfate ABC transporter permease subunit CysT [Priestia koreensis]|uniref:Sulfate transport system permease protein CysT n=1 Tax=Priestia koreensis TaxID=284581 RepID=A0A0M0L667_9BACI|nr:sulfate ABC transporter permease subunit CysT [Priestia koreensis]KOO46168.1 sulfate ABC transporter permease [Priestia koreensis]
MKQTQPKVYKLPGFGLSMGYTVLYISLIVILPLTMVFYHTAQMGWTDFWQVVSNPRVVASYRLSFGTAFIGACINAIFGVLIAWVLVRYSFPGKKLIDGLVDLPFALPTAVAGITLTTLYSPHGWLGQLFGFKIAFTPIGIVIALTFIGLPFVVRTVQPILEGLEQEVEEASQSLGATNFQTFARVIFPPLIPAILTGFSLAFARAIGEYGSVVFIAGNMPMKTEITPLIIMTKLEQYDYTGATAIATVMLLISFLLLLVINLIQRWTHKRYGGAA